MNVGKFRHKIDIEQQLTTQNGYGEPTPTWVAFMSGVYCSIEPIRGKEFFSSGKETTEVSHRIRMRYITGITARQRVKYCNRIFDIQTVININERNKDMELMVKELV